MAIGLSVVEGAKRCKRALCNELTWAPNLSAKGVNLLAASGVPAISDERLSAQFLTLGEICG